MFRIFAPRKSTLLNNTPDLQELALKLDELFAQEKELLLSVGENASDPCFRKSKALEIIMLEINDYIRNFNRITPENRIQKLELIIQFARDLLQVIIQYLDAHGDILNMPRNNNKEIGCKIIDGTVISGNLLLAFLSGSWTVCFIALAASNYVSGSIKNATSADDPKTKTRRLLDDTIKLLVRIEQNKEFELRIGREKYVLSPPNYEEAAELPQLQYQPYRPS